MRPILRAFDVTVLDGIDVDAIDVVLQVVLIANNVFIKTALPNARSRRTVRLAERDSSSTAIRFENNTFISSVRLK